MRTALPAAPSTAGRCWWAPQVPFDRGLAETVAWYRTNEWWWRPIKEQDAAYTAYYAAQYGSRPRA